MDITATTPGVKITGSSTQGIKTVLNPDPDGVLGLLQDR
jgi:hypothetical protein